MKLCAHNHEEVCFESRSCPLCAEKEESAAMTDKITELEKQVETLEDQLASLE